MSNSHNTTAGSGLQVIALSNVEDTGGGKKFLGIAAKVNDSSTVHVFVRAEDAADIRKVTKEVLNAGLQFFVAKEISMKITAALQNVVPSPYKVATRTGWHDDSFVFNGRAITRKGAHAVFVHQDLARQHVAPVASTGSELTDFLDKFGPKSDFIAFAVIVAFAQPLLGLLQVRERPVIYFWGESRTGKTTLGKLINAFTKPRSDRNLRAFDSTKRASEEILASYSDSVAVFDELNSVDDSEIEKQLKPFIYFAANGTGKSRSAGASFPDLCWRTTAVITGEKDLETLPFRRKNTGQDARLLDLAVPTRDVGGIWNEGALKRKARTPRSDELNGLVEAYSGNDYEDWIKYLVARGEEIKTRFEANTELYVKRLVGDSADSLTRAPALHFARLAAAGYELCRYGTVDWDNDMPITVIERLYRAHDARQKATSHAINHDQQTTKSHAIDHARLPAIEILARIGTGDLVTSTDGSNPDNLDAYLWGRGGELFVMIKSHALERYISDNPKGAAKALKVAGAVKSSGNTPFYQNRQDGGGRYLRVIVSELKRIAFGS